YTTLFRSALTPASVRRMATAIVALFALLSLCSCDACGNLSNERLVPGAVEIAAQMTAGTVAQHPSLTFTWVATLTQADNISGATTGGDHTATDSKTFAPSELVMVMPERANLRTGTWRIVGTVMDPAAPNPPIFSITCSNVLLLHSATVRVDFAESGDCTTRVE